MVSESSSNETLDEQFPIYGFGNYYQFFWFSLLGNRKYVIKPEKRAPPKEIKVRICMEIVLP